ncbi:MAG: Uma2 family endonuclease [Eubacterium sp.]|nr:Uma2 family endonuclease [Eubacterium sp.]
MNYNDPKNNSSTPNQSASPENTDIIRESAGSYNALSKEHLYTIADYYALPEDQRVELIDGRFYDMGAPAVIHQLILGNLYTLFSECIKKHNMPCTVLMAPCDVRLDKDNYTMVQPDLLVLCHDFDIHAIRFEGAPDLVAEILSVSSRAKDTILKLHKYQRAGVREYWIVDPKARSVTVHFFEGRKSIPQTYDFTDFIPVRISSGLCEIDFSEIMNVIGRYYA